MDIVNQKFLVLGVSKSGFAAAKYILKRGGTCYFYEELISDKITESENRLIALGGKKTQKEELNNVIKCIDVLVISPGIPINHEIAVMAKREGKRIVGELEFGFSMFNPPCIAVTGTNGKTTTVNMIGNILKNADKNYRLVGNVGVPITEVIEETDKKDILVAEVSSFQLESVYSFSPHIACLLNITPDHLERHYSMENYIFLKKRIFANLTKSEYAVLNYDDKTVRSIAEELKCNIVWVSMTDTNCLAYYSRGGLYYKDQLIVEEKDLSIKGEHNVMNALFAVACAKLMGIDNQSIINGLKTFKGARHRMEFVAEINGVKYYNDSKATNTGSAIIGIETLKQPIVLILGGSEKGEDYGLLFEKIKDSMVKHTIITGASRLNMLSCAGELGCGNITVTDDFNNAIMIAKTLSEEGDAVLLSPACASFDKFRNYEERGDAFCKIVESFIE